MLVRTPIKSPIRALDGVSFDVGPGEVCAVVGPNGAGKTTLFRILVGLTTPTFGEAHVMGFNAVDESLAIRRRLGWMPAEDGSLVFRLSCAENLRFHGRLKGLSGRRLQRAIDRSLDWVSLSAVADSAVLTLSAGMKARLQLARAMMHDPSVLVLDEPTSAVDPVGAYELLNLIVDIVEDRKVAAVISSHRLDEIEALHSHVVLLNRGKVVFDGDLDHLRQRIDRPHLELTLNSESAADAVSRMLLSRMDLVSRLEREGSTVRMVVQEGQDVGAVLASLDGSLAQIVKVATVQVPLRQLLAEVYGSVVGEDS
jgi:ABC-2 type transport system ATP-binding protein